MEIRFTWEEAKEVVIPRYGFAPYILGNENMTDIPYKRFEDIAIRYIVPIAENDDGMASYTVTNSIMNDWGITIDELDSVAAENAKRDIVPVILPMEDMFLGNGSNNRISVSQLAPGSLEHFGFYVLSNTRMVGGAPVIGNPDTLEMIAKGFGGDYYLVPSSIHEILVISVLHPIYAQDLANMIVEINSTQVQPKDKLSDNLFFYSAENKTLTKWESDEGDISHLPELDIDDLF